MSVARVHCCLEAVRRKLTHRRHPPMPDRIGPKRALAGSEKNRKQTLATGTKRQISTTRSILLRSTRAVRTASCTSFRLWRGRLSNKIIDADDEIVQLKRFPIGFSPNRPCSRDEFEI